MSLNHLFSTSIDEDSMMMLNNEEATSPQARTYTKRCLGFKKLIGLLYDPLYIMCRYTYTLLRRCCS